MELTDAARDLEADAGYLHDCVQVPSTRTRDSKPYLVISYCFTEAATKNDTGNISSDQVYSFAQLAEQYITEEQLYRWSAPIDVIENYQFYLNGRSSERDFTILGQQLYYNCTLPWFGSYCQYSLDIYQSNRHASLNKMIADFYRQGYEPTELTCYTHLKCEHATKWICLDWSDICDRFIDCKDGVDEAFCSELISNKCDDGESQCTNGQCIPETFWHDDKAILECLDGSDRASATSDRYSDKDSDYLAEPTFQFEDLVCSRHRFGLTRRTSSCHENRWDLIYKSFFFERPSSVSDICWRAMTCSLLALAWPNTHCQNLCSSQTCEQWVVQECVDMWNVPVGTLAFGHMFFLYAREAFRGRHLWPVAPSYICYNDQFCDGLESNASLISFNNATCRKPEDFPITFPLPAMHRGDWYRVYVQPMFDQLKRCQRNNRSMTIDCHPLTMYQCMDLATCIPRTNLCNQIRDCPDGDDENCAPVNNSCAKYGSTQLFHCVLSARCLSMLLVNDSTCQCTSNQYSFCEDEDFDQQAIRKRPSFPTICDGYKEVMPILIDDREETDETECEYWQCRNIYTRCDGHWNCFDGADELDCPTSWAGMNCSAQHHLCVSPETNDFMCLPIEKAGDGVPDCLGGTDEPRLCRSTSYALSSLNFHCIRSRERCVSAQDLCKHRQCADLTDFQFCRTNITFSREKLCAKTYDTNRSDVENFFCQRSLDSGKAQRVYFALEDRTKSPRLNHIQDTTALISRSPQEKPARRLYEQTCHRGLVVHLWAKTTTACMCPPSYYGNRCQYQNQRVSLSMRLDALSTYRRTPFVLVVALLDDSPDRTIHSYRQLNFLYSRDCRRRMQIYLVYSTRPKNATRAYFIHVDAYEQISLSYRGSLFFPIKHSFMPVNRVAVQLNIIHSSFILKNCPNRSCQHGECVQYVNSADQPAFCRCNEGWVGEHCHLQYRCTCSAGSICAGVSADNRSICVCPLNKWGPQCLLTHSACRSNDNNTCHRRGRCVSNDQTSDEGDPFTCICQRGFSGKRCEIVDSQLFLSFHRHIDVPQTILVHFVQLIDNGPPEMGITFKTVLTDQNTVSMMWPHPWHLAFLDLFGQNYYLIAMRTVHNQSATITRTISPLDRCAHVRELLNESLARLPLIRRIKYYHTACRDSPVHLSCFFDEVHLCLCQDYEHRRLANCLEFNHTVRHDCVGQSYCENGAECVEDRSTCPQLSICICPRCFYGVRCQFTSSGFDLSLDGILGYQIQPHTSISRQSTLVKMSAALTMIVLVGGLTSGTLSAITFVNDDARKTGSGLYLLMSSINTIFTMGVFALKFWILIISQISYVTNRSFLYAQCLSLDFLAKVGLSFDQWLAACVSVERALAAMRESKFNQKSSKQLARYVIIALVLIIISTMLQDPIYRRLLEENGDNVDQKRIWCTVQYSNFFHRYNSAILMLHVVAPVIINLLATLIIIVKTAQQRMRAQRNRLQIYRAVLRSQAQQLRHLLIAPVVFIMLAIPRLIISFTSGCMKSGGVVWMFLIGYLISFAPLMFTFMVFVYPSKSYKQIFQKTIRRHRQTALALFNRIT